MSTSSTIPAHAGSCAGNDAEYRTLRKCMCAVLFGFMLCGYLPIHGYMAQAFIDNRCALRFFADNEVIVSVPNAQGSISSERTLLTDVSVDGLNFITRRHNHYYQGQPVMLQILMPGSDHQEDIIAFGRVVWLSDPGISTCGEAIQPRIGVSLSRGDVSRLVGG